MEIKPCPVCGSHAVHHTNVSTPLTEGWSYWVGCVDESCTAGPYRRTQAEAVTAWNRLSSGMALLEDISLHLDSPLWNEEFDGVNEGWRFLRAMIQDWQEEK